MAQTLSPLFGDYINDRWVARAIANQPGVIAQPRITHSSTGSGDSKVWNVYLQPNVALGFWAWRTAWDLAKGTFVITEDAATTILSGAAVPPTGQFKNILVVGRWKWVAGAVDGGGHPLGTFGSGQMADYEVVVGTSSATPVDPAVDALDGDGRPPVILARIVLSHSDDPVLEFMPDTMLDLRAMGLLIDGKMDVAGDVTHTGGFFRIDQAPANAQDAVRKGDIEDWSVAAPANLAHYTFSSASDGAEWNPTASPSDPGWSLKLGTGYNVDFVATPSFKAHQTGVYKLTLDIAGSFPTAASLTYLNAWVAVKRAGGTHFSELLESNSDPYGQSGNPYAPRVRMTVPMALAADDEVAIFYNNTSCAYTSGKAIFEYLGKMGPNGVLAITNGDRTFMEEASPTYPRTVTIPLTSKNAVGAVTWSLTGGTAPGASITGSTLSITFTSVDNVGSYTAALHAVDSTGAAASHTIAVDMVAYSAPSLAITTGDKSFACFTSDLPYAIDFLAAASGGTTPYTWSIVAGGDTTLPSAAINATTGRVTGSMAAAGTETVKVRVTDSAGSPAVVDKILTITLTVTFDGGGGGDGCVPAGTMLATFAGAVPIENVGVGTQVRAYDETTGEHIVTTVTEVFSYGDRALVKLITGMGTLICSLDHRIMLFENTPQFIRAGEANIGNKLAWEVTPGNVIGAPITGIEFLPGTATVYHVHLAAGHVYIAGNVLAHNYKPGIVP